MPPALEESENVVQTHMRSLEQMEEGDDDVIESKSEADIENDRKRKRHSKYHSEFFQKEPCLYTHRIFEAAAQVFKFLSIGTGMSKKDSVVVEDERLQSHVQTDAVLKDISEAEKRLSFELAFAALKYQSLLEFILEDCVFFSTNPQFLEDISLVIVLFCDFQNRKFQRRTAIAEETPNPYLIEIEECLYANKTKLNASLARNRIKHQAVTVEHLLPEKLRDKEEESSKMPVSGWVNRLKTTMADMEKRLRSEGFTKTSPLRPFGEELAYFVDIHCPDLLIFSPMCRSIMAQHEVVINGMLVLQDKSSCVGPHTIARLIKRGDDVIHVNAGLGITSAHISSLLDRTSKIYAFGPTMEPDFSNALTKLHSLSATNVKLIREDFMQVQTDDPRFKACKVVFVTAICSKTAINNPIDFIVNEGEDINILRDLSFGNMDNRKLGRIANKQGDTMKHALSLPKVQAVVYQTRSMHEMENDIVCEKSIAYSNASNCRKVPYRVIPPVLPVLPSDVEHSKSISGKYLKLKATEMYSGSFLAVVAREPEEAKETAKQILAKAEAKGLFNKGKSKADLLAEEEEEKAAQDLLLAEEAQEPEEPEDILKAVLREYAAMGGKQEALYSRSSSTSKKLLNKRGRKSRSKSLKPGALSGLKARRESTSSTGVRRSSSGDSRRQSISSSKKITGGAQSSRKKSITKIDDDKSDIRKRATKANAMWEVKKPTSPTPQQRRTLTSTGSPHAPRSKSPTGSRAHSPSPSQTSSRKHRASSPHGRSGVVSPTVATTIGTTGCPSVVVSVRSDKKGSPRKQSKDTGNVLFSASELVTSQHRESMVQFSEESGTKSMSKMSPTKTKVGANRMKTLDSVDDSTDNTEPYYKRQRKYSVAPEPRIPFPVKTIEVNKLLNQVVCRRKVIKRRR